MKQPKTPCNFIGFSVPKNRAAADMLDLRSRGPQASQLKNSSCDVQSDQTELHCISLFAKPALELNV